MDKEASRYHHRRYYQSNSMVWNLHNHYHQDVRVQHDEQDSFDNMMDRIDKVDDVFDLIGLKYGFFLVRKEILSIYLSSVVEVILPWEHRNHHHYRYRNFSEEVFDLELFLEISFHSM